MILIERDVDMEQFITKVCEFLMDFGIKLFIALIVVIIGIKITSVIVKLIGNSKSFRMIEAGMRGFIKSIIKILLYILIFITAASILGIPTTSFLTMLASAGLAIGLALQGSLSNFAGGMMILFFKPFKVGDYISACGKTGTVKSVNVFYTTLVTIDNKRVTIPNGTLANSETENYSAEPERRVDMIFSASYNADAKIVKNILIACAKENELVLKDKELFAGILAYKDNCIDYALRVWCNTADYWNVYFDLNERVKLAFDEKNVEIPFPQVDVHIKDAGGNK